MADERLQPAVVRYVKTVVDLIEGTRSSALEVDARRDDATQIIEADYKTATHAAHAKVERRLARAVKKSSALLETTQADTSALLERLEREYTARRSEIIEESDSIRTKAAAQAGEAKWLAESMYEAALTEPEKVLRHAEAELTDAQRRSTALLGRIRQISPKLESNTEAFPPGPELPDPGLIDTLLNDGQAILETELGTVKARMYPWIARSLALAVPLGAGIAMVLTEKLDPTSGYGGGGALRHPLSHCNLVLAGLVAPQTPASRPTHGTPIRRVGATATRRSRTPIQIRRSQRAINARR